MKKLGIFMASLFFLTGSVVFAQDYKADTDKSVVAWTGKKVLGQHNGEISLKEGTFSVKDNKITSGKFVIEMNSITNEDLSGDSKEKLIGHLKSDDFFSTATFPTSTLVVTGSEPFKNSVAQVTGTLTIKGISQPVTFKVKREGNTYSTTMAVDRTLYNVRYGSGKFFENLGDNMIDDNFVLEVKIVAAM